MKDKSTKSKHRYNNLKRVINYECTIIDINNDEYLVTKQARFKIL